MKLAGDHDIYACREVVMKMCKGGGQTSEKSFLGQLPGTKVGSITRINDQEVCNPGKSTPLTLVRMRAENPRSKKEIPGHKTLTITEPTDIYHPPVPTHLHNLLIIDYIQTDLSPNLYYETPSIKSNQVET